MQMVKNIFIGLLLGWFLLLALMPKQELYYKLEKVLEKNDIVINEKRIESGIFSLTIYDADIYVKGINLANIKEIDFFTLLFYTTIDIDKIILDDSLKTMAPTEINTTTIQHTILSPMYVDIEAEGVFGRLDGKVNLNESTVRLDFNESRGIEMLKPNLQEDEKGWYYETSF